MKTKLQPPRRLYRVPAFVLAVLCVAGTTAPIQASDIDIQLTARRVVAQPDGHESLQPAHSALPGDIVQYDALYQNRGRRTVSKLQPTLPIPRGMEYIPDSARPAPAQASVDGLRFEPIPLKRVVKLADGQAREEEVSPTEYRALRWTVGDLPSSGTTNLVARTRVTPIRGQRAEDRSQKSEGRSQRAEVGDRTLLENGL